MKDHVIKVTIGSTDEVRVRNYLEKYGVEFTENQGCLNNNYIRFQAKKDFIKCMKQDLNLVVSSVYYDFKELKN